MIATPISAELLVIFLLIVQVFGSPMAIPCVIVLAALVRSVLIGVN